MDDTVLNGTIVNSTIVDEIITDGIIADDTIVCCNNILSTIPSNCQWHHSAIDSATILSTCQCIVDCSIFADITGTIVRYTTVTVINIEGSRSRQSSQAPHHHWRSLNDAGRISCVLGSDDGTTCRSIAVSLSAATSKTLIVATASCSGCPDLIRAV